MAQQRGPLFLVAVGAVVGVFGSGREHFDGKDFLDGMIGLDHAVNRVEGSGMEVTLPTLGTDLGFDILDDVQSSSGPVLLLHPLGHRVGITELALHIFTLSHTP